MRKLILLAALFGMLVSVGGLQAAEPRRAGLFGRAQVPAAYNKQAAVGAYGKAVYPKYRYGIHSRELQNIGVPHGDIGILGSGLSRDPW